MSCARPLSWGLGVLALLRLWEGDRLSWDTSLSHPTRANPQWMERGTWSHHPVPLPISWSCCEEQDHGFGQEGAKWMPFLCQAFLLPPGLAVALLPSSPHTHVFVESASCMGSPGRRGLLGVLSHTGSVASHGRAPQSPQPPASSKFLVTPPGSTSPVGRRRVFCRGGFLCGKQLRCADDYGFHSRGAAAATVPAPFAVLLQLASTCPLKCQPRSRGLFMQHLVTSTG